MNHWIPKVLKLLRKHFGKDYPKGGSEMKMENKNRKGVYIGNNNRTIHISSIGVMNLTRH
jgi:hypothetical protein